MVAVWCGVLTASQVLAASTKICTVTSHPITQTVAFTNPTNYWSYWLDIKPGMRIAAPPTLQLHYTYSPTLLPNLGSLTVLLNEIPLSSIRLPVPGQTVCAGTMHVTLPTALLKPGFNEIRIASRQRSIDAICQDIDHLANWMRLEPDSLLTVRYAVSDPGLIASYPFPYLNNTGTQAAPYQWYLPQNPSEDEIAAMLYTATDWGRRAPFTILPVRVSTQRPTGSGNPLLIGLSSHWTNFISSDDAQPDTGVLRSLPTLSAGQAGRLLVTGANKTGLTRAVQALAAPQLVAQWTTDSATITHDPVIDPGDQHAKVNEVLTLADMGYPQVSIRGAFHQKATLTLRRPQLCFLSRFSELNIKFRHSANLDPSRAVLTVLINGTPMGSARLDQTNAAGGTIKIALPVAELVKNSWKIDFECYHDLGAIDCSKRWDDAAWTVIDGTSFVSLRQGSVAGRPFLEGFPYVFKDDGTSFGTILMWLPATPTDDQLSLAAEIAVRAGQSNQAPLAWDVVVGDSASPEVKAALKSHPCVVLLGGPTDDSRNEPLTKALYVWNDLKAGIQHFKTLNIQPESVKDGTLMQAVKSPYNPGIVYMVWSGDALSYRRLWSTLVDPDRYAKIGGDVCMVTALNEVVAMRTSTASEDKQAVAKEAQAYNRNMILVVICLLIILAFFIRWVVKTFVPKSPARKRQPTRPTPAQWQAAPNGNGSAEVIIPAPIAPVMTQQQQAAFPTTAPAAPMGETIVAPSLVIPTPAPTPIPVVAMPTPVPAVEIPAPTPVVEMPTPVPVIAVPVMPTPIVIPVAPPAVVEEPLSSVTIPAPAPAATPIPALQPEAPPETAQPAIPSYMMAIPTPKPAPSAPVVETQVEEEPVTPSAPKRAVYSTSQSIARPAIDPAGQPEAVKPLTDPTDPWVEPSSC